jgi:DNA uptake protein ComE-like DNA-binding protein
MWKAFVREYLCFTRKERIGVLMLLALIVICTILPFFFHLMVPQKKIDNADFEKEISSLKMIPADSLDNFQDYKYESRAYNINKPFYKNEKEVRVENFYFDPNTTTAAEWARLGIRPKTVATIQKYLAKGGHFYKADDIKKIWGLRENDIRRLLPYVRLNNQPGYPPNFTSDNVIKTHYPPKPLADPVDISSADTNLFISLPGIGGKLAGRIVKFRDRLGGFNSVEQVGETFGLPDSTFQKIKSRLYLKDRVIKKININTATVEEMKVHPYIRYVIANAIYQYRLQHGNFNTITDIQNVIPVTADIYKKLFPYLTVDPIQ